MKEIERKFLVNRDVVLPLIVRGLYTSKMEILQSYLSSGADLEVRVREIIFQENYTTHRMTLKSGHGIERDEVEFDISDSKYKEIIKNFKTKSVQKTRYVMEGFEVDVYTDHNWPLITAEIELRSVDQEFTKPSWALKEITGDKQYSNASLAK